VYWLRNENENRLDKQRQKIKRSIVCPNAKNGIAYHLANMQRRGDKNNPMSAAEDVPSIT
jgi:hypothetical protein